MGQVKPIDAIMTEDGANRTSKDHLLDVEDEHILYSDVKHGNNMLGLSDAMILDDNCAEDYLQL